MNTLVGTVRDSAQSLAALARALQSDVARFKLGAQQALTRRRRFRRPPCR
ncbi:MAG TPA: hypothetical protein PK954_19650 [Anaerolineales bacterium]|nr:hypothetical protein [Anaerolineales bacterium]HRF46302.1 hypothetical protein [Anaerolineales bacterium]